MISQLCLGSLKPVREYNLDAFLEKAVNLTDLWPYCFLRCILNASSNHAFDFLFKRMAQSLALRFRFHSFWNISNFLNINLTSSFYWAIPKEKKYREGKVIRYRRNSGTGTQNRDLLFWEAKSKLERRGVAIKHKTTTNEVIFATGDCSSLQCYPENPHLLWICGAQIH